MRTWPGPNAARDAPRAAAGDGGRDGYVLPGLVCAFTVLRKN